MATPITIHFDNNFDNWKGKGYLEGSLWNAVYFANAIGDQYPGQYDITLQYSPDNRANGEITLALATDGTLNPSDKEAAIQELLNNTAGKVITGPKLKDDKVFVGDEFGGIAPAIRHDMTIRFQDAASARTYKRQIDRLVFITEEFGINNKDSIDEGFQTGDIIATSRGGFKRSGIRIDDGDPNKQINVTIYDLHDGESHIFHSGGRSGMNPNEIAQRGALIENHENLTLTNTSFQYSIVYLDQDTQKQPLGKAPIINTSTGNLTLRGDIIAGASHNYVNSLLYNQGHATFDNANVRAYDTTSFSERWVSDHFGDTVRPIGAIENTAQASLSIQNSSLSQEASLFAIPANLINRAGYDDNSLGGLFGGNTSTIAGSAKEPLKNPIE